MMNRLLFQLVLMVIVLSSGASVSASRSGGRSGFTHPGMPFTTEDLDYVKARLDVEPWKTGYQELVADSRSSLNYTMQGPFASVSRTPSVNLNEFKNDMQAIYNLARMWIYTENEAYAQKARDILINWATHHSSFDGAEMYLSMGDYTYRTFGGADILRGTWPGWTAEDTAICKAYFEDLYWDQSWIAVPHPLRSANQGILQLISGVGVAVFNDDEEKLEQCLHSFRSDPAGGLLNSLPNGQIGDTGRDGHSYGELQHLTWIAEVFWKQGIDVYADADNRLLAAGEYFSRYNLGFDTPFVQAGTVYDVYPEINTLGNNGQAISVTPDALNILHGAYVVRKGMSAPYLETFRSLWPEGADSFDWRKEVDPSTATPPAPLTPSPAVASVTGLQNADIGNATLPGSATYADGTWTVNGSGSDIWYGSNEGYHYAYLPVTGDAAIVAKLTSLEATDYNARAGLVFRELLAAGADMATIFMLYGDGADDQRMHATTRGDVAHSHPGNASRTFRVPKVPYWMKIERIGDRVTCYSSPDGASWSTSCCADFDVGETAYMGLAVCSYDNRQLNTSTFTHVRITGADGGEATQVPKAPFAIYASPSDTEVSLRWLESFEADRYYILRATEIGGPYETIAEVAGTSTVDTNIISGVTHYYAVQATNSAGISSRSKIDFERPKPVHYEAEDYVVQSGTRLESCDDFWAGQNVAYISHGDWCLYNSVPIAPGSLFLARVATGGSLSGRIEIREGSSSGTLLGSVDVPTTGGWQTWETIVTPVDATSGGRGGHTIYLKFVEVGTTTGNSMFNVNWFDIIQPESPTHLRATPISSSHIDLAWDAMPGATAYRLKRVTEGGGRSQVLTDDDLTSYSDTGLVEGRTYCYVVSAVYDGIESIDSAEVVAVPAAPIHF